MANSRDDFIIFDAISGELLRYGTMAAARHNIQVIDANEVLLSWTPGAFDIESFTGLEYIPDVNNPAVSQRPDHGIQADKTTITADGVDQCALAGIETGAQVIIAGPLSGQYTVPDGNFSFSTDQEGDYILEVIHFPKQDYRITIHAN